MTIETTETMPEGTLSSTDERAPIDLEPAERNLRFIASGLQDTNEIRLRIDGMTQEGLRFYSIGAAVYGGAITALTQYGDMVTRPQALEANAADHESPPLPAPNEHVPEIIGFATLAIVGALSLARAYNHFFGFSTRRDRRIAAEGRKIFLNKFHGSLEGLISSPSPVVQGNLASYDRNLNELGLPGVRKIRQPLGSMTDETEEPRVFDEKQRRWIGPDQFDFKDNQKRYDELVEAKKLQLEQNREKYLDAMV